MTLVPVTAGNKGAMKRRKFRFMLGFILGMNGGPKGEGMPCDVFRGVLMDFLMPVWDPLRRKRGDGGQLLQSKARLGTESAKRRENGMGLIARVGKLKSKASR